MGTEVRGAEGTGTARKTNEKMERAEEITSDSGEHFPLEQRFVILFEGKISIDTWGLGSSRVRCTFALLHTHSALRIWRSLRIPRI